MSGATLIGVLLGGPIAIDILVLIVFGAWAAWYTIARRPHGAPLLWWRHRASGRSANHSTQPGQQRHVANWNPDR